MTARYTLILGTKNWSSWSLRPYLAMRAVGVPFEEIVLRLRRSESADEIRHYSPSAKVPALKIAENGHIFTVWDSLAICETLAERHPEAGLWPADGETRALARAYAAEMHSGFAALRETLSMEFARRLSTPALSEAVEKDIARIVAAWSAALSAGRDGGFLFGKFSIADCMYAPVVSRFLTYGIALPAPLEAYGARMMELPAMRDWMAAAKAEVDAGIV
jgi:glutathione S-transferase